MIIAREMGIREIMGRGFCFIIAFACFNIVLTAQTAPPAFRPRPEDLTKKALYLNAVNPDISRGLSFSDEANARVSELQTNALGNRLGVVNLNPDHQIRVNLSRDTRHGALLLVAFNYYQDASSSSSPYITGLMNRPYEDGHRRAKEVFNGDNNGSREKGWRWRVCLGYANKYHNGVLGVAKNAERVNFVIHSRTLEWVLVLPIDSATLRRLDRARRDVLRLTRQYNQMLASWSYFSTGLNYLNRGEFYATALGVDTARAEETRRTLKRTRQRERFALDKLIRQFPNATDMAYLGFFNNQETDYLEYVERLGREIQSRAENYARLWDEADNALASLSSRARERCGVAKRLTPPREIIPPNEPLRAADYERHVFFGLNGQLSLLGLPEDTVDAIRDDMGVDFLYIDSLSDIAYRPKSGSTNYQELERVVPANKGLRLSIGLRRGSMMPWARDMIFRAPESRITRSQPNGDWIYKTRERVGKPIGAAKWNPDKNSSPTLTDAIWSDALQDYIHDFNEGMINYFKYNPSVFNYVVGDDHSRNELLDWGRAFDCAQTLFVARLTRQFQSLEDINVFFQSDYRGFFDIQLPDMNTRTQMRRLTPVYYEYAQTAKERLKNAQNKEVALVNEIDHERPSCLYGADWNTDLFDPYALFAQSKTGLFTNPGMSLASARRAYSLSRYHPRPIYAPRFNPFFADKGHVNGVGVDEVGSNVTRSALWTRFLLGGRVFCFQNQRDTDHDSSITDYRVRDILYYPGVKRHIQNAFTPVLRPRGAGLERLKHLFEDLIPILRDAPPVHPRIGLLESPTSELVPYPPNAAREESRRLEECLDKAGWEYYHIPEKALATDQEDLKGFDVIIAPCSTHLPPLARWRLLRWVKKGGTLIGSGPVGARDHYGRSRLGITNQVFKLDAPKLIVANPPSSHQADSARAATWYWDYSRASENGAKVLKTLPNGSPLIIASPYGAGNVIMTAVPIGASPQTLWPATRRVLQATLGEPMVHCQTQDAFTRLFANPKTNEHYLAVVNLNPREPIQTRVSARGHFAAAVDLTLSGGFPIPVTVAGGRTLIPLELNPGMAAFIALGKSKEQNATAPRTQPARPQTMARSTTLSTTSQNVNNLQ